MDNQQAITYVMGQLNLQFQRNQLQPIVNHYTQQQALMGRLQLWMPPPPLTLNLRELSGPPVISDKQVKAVKSFSSNLTLFIHGYNVSLGDYGRVLWTNSKTASTSQQVYYRQQDPLQCFNANTDDLYFSEQEATIWRSTSHIEQQFGIAARKLELNDDRLNGEAAHNWWLHMEHNLNQAAGFRGFDYHYQASASVYTRILNIAWAGDPASPLDYIAVEPVATKTAAALLPSIQRLFDAGIQLNVIAHSAGNIVLIKLMHLLGQQRHYHNCFQHVFMWEAAMPNNVLSPNADRQDMSLTRSWKTSKAYLSAVKIHVLYSYHDNILGPIPFHLDYTKDARLYDKWHTPGGGKNMAVTALSLDIIDQELGVPNALKSCYHIAHLFHIPFTHIIFDSDARRDVYQYWWQHLADKKQRAHCKRSLADQIRLISQKYPKAFNDLALFVSLYAAIMHDGLLAFLAGLKNDRRLEKFMRQLSPKVVDRLVHHLAHAALATIDREDRYKIYKALSQFAKTHVQFSYLKSLWSTWMNYEVSYLKHDAIGIRDFLLAKSHEHIFEYAIFYMQHRTQLDIQVWQYVLDYFKHTKKTPAKISLFKRGQVIADRGSEVAALLITLINTPGIEPRPALGYSGVDLDDTDTRNLIATGRIQQYDQSEFLLHHSAMKVVTEQDPVFQKIYKEVIMGSGMAFGQYQ